jgi:enamine deaminase RidA (YjgF/YER057c/UK114 family)
MKLIRKNLQYSDVITLDTDGSQKQFINARRDGTGELSVFDAFPPATGNMAAQMVFGGCRHHDAALERMDSDWPVLWIQGDVCCGKHISGTQGFAVNKTLSRVSLDDRVVGSMWSDEDADYCLLAGILPSDLSASRGDQTTSSLEQIEKALQEVGMDFSHVVRTWFYLERLLDWYDEFNVARTRFFESHGVFERLVPASTGIGASNPAGAALAVGALAIRPKHCNVRIHEVESPLQCSATDYRSSFSRAVEMEFPGHRMLTISGTASIAPGGESLFADDTVSQIDLTLDVVEAILKSRGMGWHDTTRAVGYFRDMRALPVFDACCRKRGIPSLPLVSAHATVCRADLLFEMELDAVVTSPDVKEKGGSH